MYFYVYFYSFMYEIKRQLVGMGGSKNAQRLVWRFYPGPWDRGVFRTHSQRWQRYTV